jgi:hypothetical protein
VGPAGPQGPAGPEGPQGPAGLATVTIIQSAPVSITITTSGPFNTTFTAQATCASRMLIGGAMKLNGPTQGVASLHA